MYSTGICAGATGGGSAGSRGGAVAGGGGLVLAGMRALLQHVVGCMAVLLVPGDGRGLAARGESMNHDRPCRQGRDEEQPLPPALAEGDGEGGGHPEARAIEAVEELSEEAFS